jgi:hypothetical protein
MDNFHQTFPMNTHFCFRIGQFCIYIFFYNIIVNKIISLIRVALFCNALCNLNQLKKAKKLLIVKN